MENLRRKPTYNELINYLEFEQPKIKYPDRRATFLRNSPYLSQFDGDSWIDLEEQENNITKEKFKEEEVKKIAAGTQTTAQLLRVHKKRMPVFGSSSGTQTDTTETTGNATQTDTTETKGNATQTDATPQPPKKTNNRTQTDDETFFDMTIDDAMDAAMEDAEAEEQAAREQEQRRRQNIFNTLVRTLGEDVRDLPYLPISTASSSRERSRSRSAAPDVDGGSGGTGAIQTVREDTGGENTKRRGRKPKVAGEGSNPMIVNQEAEQQKRSKSGETASPPARKKTKEEKEMRKIQKAIEKADKAESKQMLEIEKAVAKADKAAATTQRKKHGVVEIDNKDRKWWEKQNITLIKQQAEFKGHRFTDLETKGGTKTVGGVKTKFKKFKKPDYLEVLFKILKI